MGKIALAIAVAAYVFAMPLSDGISAAASPAVLPFRVVDVHLRTPSVPVDAVEADTPIAMTVTIRNETNRVARDVVMTFDTHRAVNMPYRTAGLGTIPAGSMSSKSFGFDISAEGCAEPVLEFAGTIASSLGKQGFTLEVNTDCPGPRLFVRALRYRGGNGDAVADPGETLQMFVRLQNAGHDVARDVRGYLVVFSAGIAVMGETSNWPDIPPGGVEENERPFVIKVSDGAARRPVCGTPVLGATSSPSPSYSPVPHSSRSVAIPPAPPLNPVGFDAVLHLTVAGNAANPNFSSGVPCLPAGTGATDVNQVRSSGPTQAPSSRIPTILIVLGVGAAIGLVVRARLSR